MTEREIKISEIKNGFARGFITPDDGKWLLEQLNEMDQEIKDVYADYKEKDLQLRLEKAKNERLRKALEEIAYYDKQHTVEVSAIFHVARKARQALAGEDKGC